MSLALPPSRSDLRRSDFPQAQLRSLARTFGSSRQPVWVHDLKGQCLYQNHATRGQTPESCAVQTPLLDATDRRIGWLRVG